MAVGARAEVPRLNLTLAQAEEQVLRTSPSLKAKQYEIASLQARADIQASLLWPRLTLEGTWRYVSEVPSLTPFPGRPSIPLGDHTNYSIGPQLSWNLWDTGSVYYNRLALEAAVQAKQAELNLLTRSLRLKARLAYFQAQLAAEQVGLLTDALRVSWAQYQDIRNQLQAGASSRIDALSSHQDVLANLRQLRQARTALAAGLRDLLNLIGQSEGLDLSLPMSAEQTGTLPPGVEAPSVQLQVDPLEQSLHRLSAAGKAALDAAHPQLLALARQSEAAMQAAAAVSSGHWPKLQVMAKTSLDYPNGPVLETIHQNTVGVNGSLSVYEFGRIVHQTEEQQYAAEASTQQREQAALDLGLAWNKAQDLLLQLKAEQALDGQAVQETDDLAKMVYTSYRAGRASYLEVQNANFRTLGAKIQAVRTQVQTLIQLATLASFSAQPTDSPEQAKDGR
jgi:outer membrane protein TolC